MSHHNSFYRISHDLSTQVFKHNVFFILFVDKKLFNVRKNYDLIDHLQSFIWTNGSYVTYGLLPYLNILRRRRTMVLLVYCKT